MMIKACLFDLDGVVFDTETLYTRFWSEVGKQYLPDLPNFAFSIKGQTLVQIYDKYFKGKEDLQKDIDVALNAFEQEMPFVYIDGFEHFIKQIKKKGIKTAVVTSSNLEKMQSVYKQHSEMFTYFNKIFTSEDFAESKPSADCYLRAAAYFGVAPQQCFVFEDSFNGLKAGKAAGARVIGLATTNIEEEKASYCEIVTRNYIGFALPND